jgi:hypothetical protein
VAWIFEAEAAMSVLEDMMLDSLSDWQDALSSLQSTWAELEHLASPGNHMAVAQHTDEEDSPSSGSDTPTTLSPSSSGGSRLALCPSLTISLHFVRFGHDPDPLTSRFSTLAALLSLWHLYSSRVFMLLAHLSLARIYSYHTFIPLALLSLSHVYPSGTFVFLVLALTRKLLFQTTGNHSYTHGFCTRFKTRLSCLFRLQQAAPHLTS